MIITLIVIAAIIIAAIVYGKVKHDVENALVYSGAAIFIIGIFIFIAGCLFNSDYYEQTEPITTTDVYESNELINLQDNNMSSGKYVGISAYGTGGAVGRIDTKNYYCYYIKTEFGYKFKKISPETEKVYIRYCSEDEKPREQKEREAFSYKKIIVKKPNIWYSNPLNYANFYEYEIGDVYQEVEDTKIFSSKTVLYVPEGSIVENYEIDMQ